MHVFLCMYIVKTITNMSNQKKIVDLVRDFYVIFTLIELFIVSISSRVHYNIVLKSISNINVF